MIPARLFIIGGKETRLREGANHGDAMTTCEMGLTPLLEDLESTSGGSKYVTCSLMT